MLKQRAIQNYTKEMNLFAPGNRASHKNFQFAEFAHISDKLSFRSSLYYPMQTGCETGLVPYGECQTDLPGILDV